MASFTHITKIISDLLHKHDCVILPNFGGFVARHHSASFSKGMDLMLPPSKQVLFNKNLIHNDGLLVNAVSEAFNISYNNALKTLEDYKDYIQSLLQVKKRFELEQIGLLYIDSEQILRFEQKIDVNFLIESFGFEPIVAQLIPVQEEPKIITVDRLIERTETPIVPTIAKKKRSYLKMAAITISAPLIFASLFFALSSKHINPLMESSVNPFHITERVYHPISDSQLHLNAITLAKSESPVITENGLVYYKIENSDKVIIASITDNNAAVPNTKTTEKKSKIKQFDASAPFQVVVGCFGVEENANRLIRDLQKNNISAAISGINAKGLHVVSCGGFTSKDEAASKLDEIKVSFPSAWIMAK